MRVVCSWGITHGSLGLRLKRARPGRPSRPRALDAGQPPEAAGLRRYLANGSSYSLTLSLSSAWSEASCSRMYFAMVASFRPTVET